MSVPFTIQPMDNERLIHLKSVMNAKSKVDVLRRALDSLEEQLAKQKRLKQWKAATKRVASQSAGINQDFQKHALIKKGFRP